jgi:hypothetical protein
MRSGDRACLRACLGGMKVGSKMEALAVPAVGNRDSLRTTTMHLARLYSSPVHTNLKRQLADLTTTCTLQTAVENGTPSCVAAQGGTDTMSRSSEPRPFDSTFVPSFGVVYCSFCYWPRKAGTSCASKGSEQASSGTADLFGSAPTPAI